LSEPVAVPASAWLPPWTGLPTTEPVDPEHDQPDNEPVSKSPLVSRLAANAGTVAAKTPAATTVAASPATRSLDRFTGAPLNAGTADMDEHQLPG
jgi:hypothetical protein